MDLEHAYLWAVSQAKEQARNSLARKYKSGAISEEEILQCLYSIADNNTFLTFNRDPIDRMLALLKVGSPFTRSVFPARMI